jgi:hypothetical protein
MNSLNWDNNLDSMCSCAHTLRVHTFSCYQDISKITSLTGLVKHYSLAPVYTEWKCEDCDCKEFIEDNLRFLEIKYEESQSKARD